MSSSGPPRAAFVGAAHMPGAPREPLVPKRAHYVVLMTNGRLAPTI